MGKGGSQVSDKELQGIGTFCFPSTGSLISLKKLRDFVFHCRVYKELYGTAKSPHRICKILYSGKTREATEPGSELTKFCTFLLFLCTAVHSMFWFHSLCLTLKHKFLN